MKYADLPLGEIAVAIPRAAEVFRKYRLDFCCGGSKTLRESCESKKLAIREIENELSELKTEMSFSFEDMSLGDMTLYIIDRYHQDLRKRLPGLIALAEKVEKVHGDHPAVPLGLNALLTEMFEELQKHMAKEENVLFPLIRNGSGHMAAMPIKVMNNEHDAHGKQLNRLHELTSDFTPPADACGTWRVLYSGLEQFEEELMDHIHIENNILFPRALNQKLGA